MAEKYIIGNNLFFGLNKIGQGNFGETYNARDKDGNTIGVVKVLTTTGDEVENERDAEVYYSQEARSASPLCRNRVIDNFKVEDTSNVIFSKPFGTPFLKVREEMNLATLCKCIVQLLQSVQCFHQKHLVHGDIHEENIIIDNDKLYLIDLGTTHKYSLLDNMTGWTTAPEGAFDNKSDIYSLGWCILQMLVGSAFSLDAIISFDEAFKEDQALPAETYGKVSQYYELPGCFGKKPISYPNNKLTCYAKQKLKMIYKYQKWKKNKEDKIQEIDEKIKTFVLEKLNGVDILKEKPGLVIDLSTNLGQMLQTLPYMRPDIETLMTAFQTIFKKHGALSDADISYLQEH